MKEPVKLNYFSSIEDSGGGSWNTMQQKYNYKT